MTAKGNLCACWFTSVALHDDSHCCFRDWPDVHCHCVQNDGHEGPCEPKLTEAVVTTLTPAASYV